MKFADIRRGDRSGSAPMPEKFKSNAANIWLY
jgi:hypothetical protein